jgi:hypothetical protein
VDIRSGIDVYEGGGNPMTEVAVQHRRILQRSSPGAASARQKMVEHRESCEVCREEDLALKVGEVPRPAFAEIS